MVYTWKTQNPIFLLQLNRTCKNDLFVQVCSVAQLCLTLCNSMDYIACQAPLSMEFPRQGYWNDLDMMLILKLQISIHTF